MASTESVLNITQFIQVGKGPLRRSFLDYGHVSNANDLNAIAATASIIALNALIVGVIFVFGGLCTHSAALSSMVRGSFISDCVVNAWFRASDSKLPNYRRNVRVKVVGASLVMGVFVIDVLLTLSQTAKSETVSSQQLELGRPAISLYDGESKYYNASNDCFPLVNCSSEIRHRDISLCATASAGRSSAFAASGGGFLGVYVNTLFERALHISVFTHEWLHTLRVSVVLEVSNVDDGTSEFNITKVAKNNSEVSLWLVQRVSRLYTCDNNVSGIEGIDAMYGASGCDFDDSFEVASKTHSLFLSTLSLSSELYSSDDFLQLNLESFVNWSTVVSAAGRQAMQEFGVYERSRVDGGVLWIVAGVLVGCAGVAGFFAVDFELAVEVAVAEKVSLESSSPTTQEH